MKKNEIIEKIEKIVEEANAIGNGFKYETVINDWQNYGKDRTYISVVETRNYSKHHKTIKYGYYDNAADIFVQNDTRKGTYLEFVAE